MVNAETRETHNPVLGGSTKKVCTYSDLLAYVAEIILGIPWGCCDEGEATTF